MDKRFFGYGELSNQQQKNVREAYARPGLGEILFVIDDTAFRGSKDGLILTENFIATKEAFREPNYYPIKSITRIEADNKKIIINNQVVREFALAGATEIRDFVVYFRTKYINRVNEADNRKLNSTTQVGAFPAIGKVFVQVPDLKVGKSSYHFDSPENVYIKFNGWGNDKFPEKKQFTHTKFYPENRVFIGLIDWSAEGGFQGEMLWLYFMVFNENYSAIEDGYLVVDGMRVSNFPKDLIYIDLSSLKPQSKKDGAKKSEADDTELTFVAQVELGAENNQSSSSMDLLKKPSQEESKVLATLENVQKLMRGGFVINASRNRGSNKEYMQNLSCAEFISDITEAATIFHKNLAKEARNFNELDDLFMATPFSPILVLSFIGAVIFKLLRKQADYSKEWAFSYSQFPMFIAVKLHDKMGVNDSVAEMESITSFARSQAPSSPGEGVFLEDFMGLVCGGVSLKDPQMAGYSFIKELIDLNKLKWGHDNQKIEDGLKKLQQQKEFTSFIGNQFIFLLPHIEESVTKILKQYGPHDEHPILFKFKTNVVEMLNSRLYG